jgi:hypothetical protein
MQQTYTVKIRDEHTQDDGLRVEIPVSEDYWANLQTGACPDCDGKWVWAENGGVPGTRKCHDCGSVFTVLGARYDGSAAEKAASQRGVAILRRERYY